MCSVASVMSALCDSMDCSSPGSSIHRILQAGILKGSPCPAPGDLPNLGIKPLSPARQVIFFFHCWTTREAPAITVQLTLYPFLLLYGTPIPFHLVTITLFSVFTCFCLVWCLFFFFFISFETSFLNHKLFRGLWLNCLIFKGFLLYFLYCFLVCSIREVFKGLG